MHDLAVFVTFVPITHVGSSHVFRFPTPLDHPRSFEWSLRFYLIGLLDLPIGEYFTRYIRFSHVECLADVRNIKVPQLIENYTQGSAAGISLAFLSVWFLGDITNLSGALWAGLVPTVTALAVYFCFADLILISQCLYYNVVNARRKRKLSQMSSGTEGSVEEPLLARRRRSSIGLPGSHRRSSASAYGGRSSLTSIVEEGSGRRAWIKNTVSIFLVCVAGIAGWAIAWQSGVWKPTPELDDQVGGTPSPLGAQILGYASAVCYLGARIPQIVKNQREKSCEGLSLLFFLLSLLGNLTYGAGVSHRLLFTVFGN